MLWQQRTKLRKYHPDRAAHISHELIEKHRYKLGIYAQKLLFALAQNLDTTTGLFPERHINITDLFRYLNLSERNNDRYDYRAERDSRDREQPDRISDQLQEMGGVVVALANAVRCRELQLCYHQVFRRRTAIPPAAQPVRHARNALLHRPLELVCPAETVKNGVNGLHVRFRAGKRHATEFCSY